MRILIVEDEVRLAKLIREDFRAEGLLADVAIRGEDALWLAGSTGYDAICLGVNLAGIDGFETCRRLRRDGIATPILMLTARDEIDDRVTGLDTGADDYLVKPLRLRRAAGAVAGAHTRSGRACRPSRSSRDVRGAVAACAARRRPPRSRDR